MAGICKASDFHIFKIINPNPILIYDPLTYVFHALITWRLDYFISLPGLPDPNNRPSYSHGVSEARSYHADLKAVH